VGIELWVLFLVAVGYLAILFLIAHSADKGYLPAGLVDHPLTYALSLGVYATSWTYYGSVGLAAQSGFAFITIYLGVTGATYSPTAMAVERVALLLLSLCLLAFCLTFLYRYAQ